MVPLKIVHPSNGPLYPCFPCIWYAVKSFPVQMAHFIHVFLANCMPYNHFPNQMVHFIHLALTNGAPYNRFPLKWPTLSMFPLHMVRRKIVSRSNGTLYPCFPCKLYALKWFPPSNGALYPCLPRKWYALKSFPPQMLHFIYVSLSKGTP